MKLTIQKFDLRLRHRFSIAHDSRVVQTTVVVALSDGRMTGFGEATASVFYRVSAQDTIDCLELHRGLIESYDYEDPALYWDKLKQAFGSNSFALSAIDVAINDLYAKSKKASLINLWGLDINNFPTTNYTIGIDSMENMVKRMKEFPWPLYKIKLGTEEDLSIIRELRKHTLSVFRVDANCSWTVDETLANAKEMTGLGVEFIEQPLAVENWEGMKHLYQYSDLPIVADESILVETDIDRCVGIFHGVNIKLMKCGGLTPARRMISNAKKRGLKVMVGCMTESSVGISAIAQLAPMLDYVDMDGFLLLKDDLAKGPVVEGQSMILPKGWGIGINELTAVDIKSNS